MVELSLSWITAADGLLMPADLPENLTPARATESKVRLASVLVPLFWHQGEWHLLFIRRVESLRDRHSGQVAFPGGRRDPADASTIATALREAEEEVGLAPASVNVIGTLANYHTSSNFDVTPVVAIVPWPYDYRAQPSEVDRIFSIPLSWLADERQVELRDRSFKLPELRDRVEMKVVYYNRYDGELLWGATARMTLSFLKALHDKQIVLDRPEA